MKAWTSAGTSDGVHSAPASHATHANLSSVHTVSRIRFIGKPGVFLLCLLPAMLVILDAFEITGSLGANPVEAIQDRFGIWGLRFIMIALAVTPLRRLTGRAWLARFRRMLGLFAFFYVLLHFLTWLFLDQGLLLSAIVEDIVERPFITIGFAAFLLLTAMAATSTNGMRRRMGVRWQQLHYSVYAVGVLGVWHFWWQVKLDTSEPTIYAAILGVLLGYRLYTRISRRHSRSRSGRPAAPHRTARPAPD